MKSHVVAAIVLLSATGGAWAADVSAPRPAVKAAVVAPAKYDWTGLYIGGNVGYGWARVHGATIGGFSASVDLRRRDRRRTGGLQLAVRDVRGRHRGRLSVVRPEDIDIRRRTLPSHFGIRDRPRPRRRRRRQCLHLRHRRLRPFRVQGRRRLTVSETENWGGWTVGAGIDVAVVGNLIARAEYLYLQSFDKDRPRWAPHLRLT